MANVIQSNRQPDGSFIVTVDGASKECANWSEAYAVIGSEGGTPSARVHRELFVKYKKLEQENAALTKERDRYKDWWLKAYNENGKLTEAIKNCFVKEYAK